MPLPTFANLCSSRKFQFRFHLTQSFKIAKETDSVKVELEAKLYSWFGQKQPLSPLRRGTIRQHRKQIDHSATRLWGKHISQRRALEGYNKGDKKTVMPGIEIHGDEVSADTSGSSETSLGFVRKAEGKCALLRELFTETWEELSVLPSPSLWGSLLGVVAGTKLEASLINWLLSVKYFINV